MINPYVDKPQHQFWRRVVSNRLAEEVDPVTNPKFQISRNDRITTAGSCFAQHIARHLYENSFNFFVPESHEANQFSENENFGVFSARYGNVYTVRQLLQLFQRAYGLFEPLDVFWKRPDGKFVDPFRPRIQSNGFQSPDELVADRACHFDAVRKVFEESDVFIFTLGLTEGWVSSRDRAVFPLAPGVVGSDGDDSAYVFHNFTVEEMQVDISTFISALHIVNPECRVLLTVSPVALVATFEDQHVLSATSYSKSALRVVAQSATRLSPLVDYFPSYEIITGPQARAVFFEADLREVTQEGVAHVMKVFGRHYLWDSDAPQVLKGRAAPSRLLQNQNDFMREVQDIICDEEQIEQHL